MEHENLRVMYFHGWTIDNYRFTIAGVIDDPNLTMAISVCSDLDNFNRRSGRSIATTRLLSERNVLNLGRIKRNLYTMPDNKKTWSTEEGYPRNYFVYHEFEVFTQQAAEFNTYTKRELLKSFNLWQKELPF